MLKQMKYNTLDILAFASYADPHANNGIDRMNAENDDYRRRPCYVLT